MVKKLAAVIVFIIISAFGSMIGGILFGISHPLVFLYGWLMFGFASYVTDLMLEKKVNG